MQRFTLPTLSLLLLPLAACSVTPGGGFTPTPQRPTLSSDTNTTAPGSIEIEAGASIDPSDTTSAPVTVKYGIAEGKEVYISGAVFQHVEFLGENEMGIGDLTLGGRMRFYEDEKVAAAGLLAMKFPTADESEGLGTGEFDMLGAGILTAPMGDNGSITGYYELGLLGDPTGGINTQHLFAFAPSISVSDEMSVFAELALYKRQEGPDSSLLLMGVNKMLAPDMVADAGVVFGINDAAPDFSLFLGMTVNLGKAPQGDEPAADAEGSVRRSASLYSL